MRLAGYLLLSLALFACTEGEFTVKKRVGDASVVYATFNGWNAIKAVGAKAPAAQATDLSAAGATVTLSWSDMTPASGSVASYKIYRATTPGGQNYSAPLASGISAVTKTYTDTSVTGGETYYYTVGATLADGTSTRPALSDSDREVKVIVPPANMVLLHRWAANADMCADMGKTVLRSQNYGCVVAQGGSAPPGTGGSGLVDLGQSIFIDTYEQGCNYTYDPSANKCGSANGCIGILSNPNGVVTGNNGDIYYSRRSGACYINTSAGAGTTWLSATATSAGNRGLMGSAAPGLPPMNVIDQTGSRDVCLGQTVSGFAGTKRLLKYRERLIASAWDASLADATVTTMENGVNLDSTHHCNSNYASPQGNSATDISGTNASIAYDNLALPAAKDTLPACRFADCSAAGIGIRPLRTGSVATSACVSKYGAQDLVGNMWEWTSDQISCNGASCTGVTSALDASNDDFNGVAFNGTQGANTSNTFTTFGKIQFPIGIPIAGAGFTGDGTVTRTAAQFHDDGFYIALAASTRGTLAGGSWGLGSASGRFALNVSAAPSTANTYLGLRCALPAD